MRRGCTSLGDVQCDECQRSIPYPERYMVIDDEKGKVSRLCVDCCVSKGYARYTDDKGQQVLTFFPERAESLPDESLPDESTEEKQQENQDD